MSKIKPRSRKVGTAKRQNDRRLWNAQISDLKLKNQNLRVELAHETDMAAQAHVGCTQLQADLAEVRRDLLGEQTISSSFNEQCCRLTKDLASAKEEVKRLRGFVLDVSLHDSGGGQSGEGECALCYGYLQADAKKLLK